ncbi:MAG: protein kinase [Deltaproteobacteria bacterium]|nr:protein kinase [Deltaproteobacteria bacterium]
MFVPFDLVGKKFEQLQINEFIGRGPMGYVYRAFEPATQQTLALKLFPKTPDETTARDEEFRETFFRESEAARLVRHPTVSAVLAVGETPEFHFLCTEFVAGKSLEDIINEQGPLPLETALPLFKQILSGLEAAHEKNLVHRNLKPSNILIKKNGQIKLTDFAQAKIPSMAATMAFSGTGSPFYMAPEQLLGQRGDIRSDIFSVGALLYLVLTGEKPFDGESTATIADRVIQREALSPKNINPHIPEILEKISARAMAKDPSGRYQTPGEMLADLEAFEPIGTGPLASAGTETDADTRAEKITPEPETFLTEKLSAVLPFEEEFSKTVAIPPGEVPFRAAEEEAPPITPISGEPQPVPEEHQPAPAAEIPRSRLGFKPLLAGLFLLLILISGAVLLFRWNPDSVRLSTPSGPSPAPNAPPVVSSTPLPTQAPTLPATPVNPPAAKVPAPTSPPATTEQLLQQAATLWNTDLDKARSLLEQAVAQSPNNFEAHFQLGRLLTQKKRFPAAIQEYHQALNLNNRVPEVYFNLGYIHLIQGNYDLAIQHLEWCRALNPTYQDEVLTNIGIVYLRKRNQTQARLYLKEAVALNPRNDLARNYLKNMNSDDKDHKKKDRHD